MGVDQTIHRTKVEDCPNCLAGTQHTKENWNKYHPLAGTGSFADIEVGESAKKRENFKKLIHTLLTSSGLTEDEKTFVNNYIQGLLKK